MFENETIGFIGGGNMGEALIKGMAARKVLSADQILVCDILPERLKYLRENYEVRTEESAERLCQRCGVVVLAVKPQVMAKLLRDIHDHLSHDPLVVSIAAGLSLDFFTHRLPDSVPLVRVMPNTPSLVLEGLSAVSRGSNAGDEHVARVRALFEAVGRVVEVEERHMDAVTAISGSGPAYVLLVIEAMIDAGVFAGLARPLARELAIQTVLGTARMTRETGRHPAELRDMITSPGGTTIHAMRVLEDEAVRAAIMNAVEAAVERAGELGQG